MVSLHDSSNKDLAGTYNVGPSFEGGVVTKDLVSEMNKVIPFHFEVDKSTSIGHENPLLQLDSSLIREKTDWTPIYDNYNEVIKETATWYSNVDIKDINSALDETLTQIRKGLSLYGN